MTLIMLDNSLLGLVKLERRQGGLPESGTVLRAHGPSYGHGLAAVVRT